jgi:hypothetical protein
MLPLGLAWGHMVCSLYCLQGLADLFKFQRKHPTFNLEDVLMDQTKFYRDYIMRGLHHIREGAGSEAVEPPKSESEVGV